MLFSLFTCLMLAVSVQAQQATRRLDIYFNKNILLPGDSLLVTVNYVDSSSQATNGLLATLELIVENEDGMRTRLRWPMINGQATGTLYLPDSLPRGKYTLLAGLQQRFFEVKGKIQDARRTSSIQAMILTKTGDWDEQEVPVSADGTFTIRNWLFENNALLAFSRTNNNNQLLNISISTQLDSSHTPLAVAGKAFYIGNPSSAVRSMLNQPIEATESIFADRGTILPAVVVKTTARTPAQQFNEENVSALFRSMNERVISIMDEPSALGFFNVLAYLQGRVAGLQIMQAGFNGGAAIWRGQPVTFFLDEVRVSGQVIANIPMADIAIVKVYPPPFMGAPGGGGAIAVYTRRGGESNYFPPNKQVFRVRGYTPAAIALDINKLRL